MTRLFYLEASPRKERSFSIALASRFLEAFSDTHPAAEIDHFDLWSEQLPDFDGGALNAAQTYRLMGDSLSSDDERRAWDAMKAVFDRFNAADAYLIATPMWNFSVPYRLKQYIDVMTQPGLAFTYSADGVATGHVTGRPAVMMAARGGAYPAGSDFEAMDHQVPWLETILRFIGFEDIRVVTMEPTIGAPDQVSARRVEALDQAAAAGRALAARVG